MPLTRIRTRPSPRVEHLQRLAIENPHFVIGAVRHDQKFLVLVRRKRDGERRAARVERSARDEAFFDELSIERKHLDPVVHPIGHVDEAVA